MGNKVKSGLAALIACWLAFWPLLFIAGIEFHREKTHSSLEIKLKSDLAETLSVKKSDFPNLAQQKEFDYNGQRYDVVSVDEDGDTWKVLAINDKKEKWMEEQAGKKRGEIVFSGFWIKTEMLEHSLDIAPPLVLCNLLSAEYLFSFDRVFQIPNSPPPEGFVV